MRRQRYKGHIVVARLLQVRFRPVWHASVSLDQLVDGVWQEIPIQPGLAGQEFASEDSALAAALNLGHAHVDILHDSPRPFKPAFDAPAFGSAAVRTSFS
jgi:hypothetical protein